MADASEESPPPTAAASTPPALTGAQVAAAAAVAGLAFTDAEQALMLEGLEEKRAAYAQIRAVPLPNALPPAFVFDPRLPGTPRPPPPAAATAVPSAAPIPVPADLEELAFAPVTQLAALLRTGRVSSVALTEMYLRRLQRYGPLLHCVVTLTAERALAQARQADAELATGHDRGPLHGIPWGAKDLLATRGIRTTWGAAPYQDQVPDRDATVVARLDAAGAVLVAKLSVGELAWGDVWFGGTTRNPWDLAAGASGSSAGSAAATAAGLVGFALGTETWGSIVSPCTRCGVTGLRPTFGRVSRQGAMALAWSMDKIGPVARTVADCALVFAAISGPDGQDRTVVDAPFAWDPARDLRDLRIGYVASAFAEEHDGQALDAQMLDRLRALGAVLQPIALPDYPIAALSFILSAEAAAAFDELTRSDRDDLLVRQEADAWPNVLREARLIPAVEYIQANRVRTLLMQEMAALFDLIDVYVAPSFGGHNLLLTNLTGHPAVVVPNGRTPDGAWNSITFTGPLDGEATALAVAHAYQEATGFHHAHPILQETPAP
ncbi:MAG TPA: amidase [Chloroflexia bacterium]|nr:amidase [Chloroflexia bacterium]